MERISEKRGGERERRKEKEKGGKISPLADMKERNTNAKPKRRSKVIHKQHTYHFLFFFFVTRFLKPFSLK